MNPENPKQEDGDQKHLRCGRWNDPIEWTVNAGAFEDVRREMDIRIRARRKRRQLAVSCLVAAVSTIALVHHTIRTSPPRPESPVLASAAASTPARQILSDGSVVELGQHARIVVQFSPSLRRVVLVEGQALFQVAKNPSAPFVVSAGSLEVRAVGTAFTVELRPSVVEVLVTEGCVALDKTDKLDLPLPSDLRKAPAPSSVSGSAPSRSPKTIAFVKAGELAVVDRPTTQLISTTAVAVTPVSAADLSTRLAWRVPKLEFSGTPLSDAIVMINRYSKVQLTLGDAVLSRVRVSGMVRGDNVEALCKLLEDEHLIRIERISDTQLKLVPPR